jgi:shikimate kinase
MNRLPLDIRKARVFLTGFMGSGKSTVGPILANAIGYDYVDTDTAIEQREGKTIGEIFDEAGEGLFRSYEEALILSLCEREKIVVSLGGGSLVNERNLQAVVHHGILIYLRTDPLQLAQRLARKRNRPLLRDADGVTLTGDALIAHIKSLYLEREQTYRQADFSFETTDIKVGITVDQISRALSGILPR